MRYCVSYNNNALLISQSLKGSNSVVCFLRFATGAQIKGDEVGQYDAYLLDVENPASVEMMAPDQWCARYVDPMGQEAGE